MQNLNIIRSKCVSPHGNCTEIGYKKRSRSDGTRSSKSVNAGKIVLPRSVVDQSEEVATSIKRQRVRQCAKPCDAHECRGSSRGIERKDTVNGSGDGSP